MHEINIETSLSKSTRTQWAMRSCTMHILHFVLSPKHIKHLGGFLQTNSTFQRKKSSMLFTQKHLLLNHLTLCDNSSAWEKSSLSFLSSECFGCFLLFLCRKCFLLWPLCFLWLCFLWLDFGEGGSSVRDVVVDFGDWEDIVGSLGQIRCVRTWYAIQIHTSYK